MSDQIWQSRNGKEPSPEANWTAAIEALEAEQSIPGESRWIWQLPKSSDEQKLALELTKLRVEWVKVAISVLGLGATIVAGVGLLLNYYQGSERLITDRYGKAVEQLGVGDISVRIGGIYALERIANPKDHWTIMEVLTAFVRERSPKPTKAATQKPGKAQAKGPHFSFADLSGADFSFADLHNANLLSALLNSATLTEDQLKEALLCKTTLMDGKTKSDRDCETMKKRGFLVD